MWQSLSIAYDNVHYKDKPEPWNMRMVLGVATVLGFLGPVAAFGLFYILVSASLSPRPRANTDVDVPDAVRSGTFDVFSYTYSWPVLVHTPSPYFVGGCSRYSSSSDFYSCLWTVYDAYWVEVGTVPSRGMH